jgi:3-methylcrotonyl-CoA carboxylase alpha subunit
MDDACRSVAAFPVKHNAWFLSRLTQLDEYRQNSMTTGTIEAHQNDLLAEPQPSNALVAAAAMDSFFDHVAFDDTERAKGLLGFRLNSEPRTNATLSFAGSQIEAPLDLSVADQFFDGEATWWATQHHAYFENGAAFVVRGYRAEGGGAASAADGAIIAPMPGKVIAVDVAEGQAVTAGQRLMVLEAMKMEHALTAPFDGTVTELSASVGGQVQVEAVLCVVEPQSE